MKWIQSLPVNVSELKCHYMMVFMLRVCSTHCKLFEMILTSSDPWDLKRKRLEKDKLCGEESRLA